MAEISTPKSGKNILSTILLTAGVVVIGYALFNNPTELIAHTETIKRKVKSLFGKNDDDDNNSEERKGIVKIEIDGFVDEDGNVDVQKETIEYSKQNDAQVFPENLPTRYDHYNIQQPSNDMPYIMPQGMIRPYNCSDTATDKSGISSGQMRVEIF